MTSQYSSTLRWALLPVRARVVLRSDARRLTCRHSEDPSSCLPTTWMWWTRWRCWAVWTRTRLCSWPSWSCSDSTFWSQSGAEEKTRKTKRKLVNYYQLVITFMADPYLFWKRRMFWTFCFFKSRWMWWKGKWLLYFSTLLVIQGFMYHCSLFLFWAKTDFFVQQFQIMQRIENKKKPTYLMLDNGLTGVADLICLHLYIGQKTDIFFDSKNSKRNLIWNIENLR